MTDETLFCFVFLKKRFYTFSNNLKQLHKPSMAGGPGWPPLAGLRGRGLGVAAGGDSPGNEKELSPMDLACQN